MRAELRTKDSCQRRTEQWSNSHAADYSPPYCLVNALPVKSVLALDPANPYALISKFGVKTTGSMPSRSFTACRSLCLQPQVLLCGLHRYMTEQELDLFQFASRIVTESSVHDLLRSLWRELEIPSRSAYSLTTCQTTFFSDLRSPNSPFSTNAAEDFAVASCAIAASHQWCALPNLAWEPYGCARLFLPGQRLPNDLRGAGRVSNVRSMSSLRRSAHPRRLLESRDPSFPLACSYWEVATESEPHPLSANFPA
jgi:hypothetical protein